MKKIFIAALLLAAVAGGYYLYHSLSKPARPSHTNEFIIGNWKIDSLSTDGKDSSLHTAALLFALMDSNFYKRNYFFGKEGEMLVSFNGFTDTGKYVFTGTDTLIINDPDSTAESFKWVLSDTTHLKLLGKDGISLYFTKIGQ